MSFTEILAKGLISFASDKTTYFVGTLVVAVLSYLVGSVNFSLIFGANETAKKGKKAAAFVCDALKGAVCVFIGMLLMPADGFSYVAALFCMVGHAFPLFFGFHGSGCIAVFVGAVLFLNPIAAIFALLIYAIVIMFSKYLSASAMAMALAFPIINYYFAFSFFTLPFDEMTLTLLVNNILRVSVPILMAAMMCVSYIKNIKNIAQGTEKKI